MTPSEALLWSQLRSEKLGFKVRRQHPIGPYVADFFVRDAGLVIEIDGSPHDYGIRPQRDIVREGYLKERGYCVLHVLSRDVIQDLEAVLRLIVVQVTRPLHHPSDGPPPRPGEDC